MRIVPGTVTWTHPNLGSKFITVFVGLSTQCWQYNLVVDNFAKITDFGNCPKWVRIPLTWSGFFSCFLIYRFLAADLNNKVDTSSASFLVFFSRSAVFVYIFLVRWVQKKCFVLLLRKCIPNERSNGTVPSLKGSKLG